MGAHKNLQLMFQILIGVALISCGQSEVVARKYQVNNLIKK